MDRLLAAEDISKFNSELAGHVSAEGVGHQMDSLLDEAMDRLYRYWVTGLVVTS